MARHQSLQSTPLFQCTFSRVSISHRTSRGVDPTYYYMYKRPKLFNNIVFSPWWCFCWATPQKKFMAGLDLLHFFGRGSPVFTNQRRFPLPNRRFFPFSFLACPNNPSHANHEKVNFDFLRFALMMHHFYTRPHRSPWNPWHPGEDARNFGTDTEIILHRLNESFFKNTVVKWHSKRARFHVSPALQHDLDEHS